MSNQLLKLSWRAIVYAISDFIQKGLAFILIPLYTIYLVPSDYGILNITSAATGILCIFFLQSFEGAFTRFYYDFDSNKELKEYFGSTWLFLLIYSIILCLILDQIGTRTNCFGFRSVPYNPYIRIAVWTAVIGNITLLLPKTLFLVRENIWKFCSLNLSLTSFTVIFIVYFVVYKHEGALGCIKGPFVAGIIVGLPALWVIFNNIRFCVNYSHIKKTLIFALPLLPHLLSLWALNLSDRFILERYVSLKDIGIYALGYQIASILQVIAYSATNAITPFYYKTASSAPNPEKTLKKVTTYFLFALAWIGIWINAYSYEAIQFLALKHPAYEAAYKVIPWALLGFFSRGFYFIFSTAIYYAKRLKYLTIVTITASFLNIILNIISIPYFGYMAAAVNTFFGFAFQALVIYFFAQKCYMIKYEFKRICLICVFFLFELLVTFFLSFQSICLNLLLKTALALSFPFFLYMAGFYSNEEIDFFKKFINKYYPQRLT